MQGITPPLYIDGWLVTSNASVTTALNTTGYWRWGGAYDLSTWPNGPTNGNLTGTLDEVAIYSSQLSDQQIAWHYYANH